MQMKHRFEALYCSQRWSHYITFRWYLCPDWTFFWVYFLFSTREMRILIGICFTLLSIIDIMSWISYLWSILSSNIDFSQGPLNLELIPYIIMSVSYLHYIKKDHIKLYNSTYIDILQCIILNHLHWPQLLRVGV